MTIKIKIKINLLRAVFLTALFFLKKIKISVD